MSDDGSRFGRLRERSREWMNRAASATPHILPWVGALIAAALAITIGWAVVLLLGRASADVSASLVGGAPLLGRVLGYLFMAALLAGGAAFFFVAIAAIVRLSSWALSAIATLTENRVSQQAERYVVAGLLALLPAAGIYFVATQPAFLALPLELKQHLIPVLLPLAIGAAAAPTWGRGQALTLTVFSLLAVAGVIAAAGYLWPLSATAPASDPFAAIWYWSDLMRQTTLTQRIWWMLLIVFAILFWAIAVFAGSREGELAVTRTTSIRFNPMSPAASTA